MSASELIPTMAEQTEYMKEPGAGQVLDPVYMQMLEQISNRIRLIVYCGCKFTDQIGRAHV